MPPDFSPHADAALAAAAALARHLGADLFVVHVISDEEVKALARSGMDRRGPDDILQDLVRAAEDRALAVAGPRPGGGGAAEELVVDLPAPGIVQAARRLEADLIVMSTHGRSGLARAVMWSVAEGVLRHAPCPVFVIRPARN